MKELEEKEKSERNNRPAVLSISHHKRNKTSMIGDKGNEDLVNFLEHKLEEIEKKLVKTQQDYESLYNTYIELKEKMSMSREKYKRAALLMTEFLDDLLTQTPNILDNDKDLHVNLEKIKET